MFSRVKNPVIQSNPWITNKAPNKDLPSVHVCEKKKIPGGKQLTKAKTTKMYCDQLAPLYPYLTKAKINAALVLSDNNLHETKLILDYKHKLLAVKKRLYTPTKQSNVIHKTPKKSVAKNLSTPVNCKESNNIPNVSYSYINNLDEEVSLPPRSQNITNEFALSNELYTEKISPSDISTKIRFTGPNSITEDSNEEIIFGNLVQNTTQNQTELYLLDTMYSNDFNYNANNYEYTKSEPFYEENIVYEDDDDENHNKVGIIITKNSTGFRAFPL